MVLLRQHPQSVSDKPFSLSLSHLLPSLHSSLSFSLFLCYLLTCLAGLTNNHNNPTSRQILTVASAAAPVHIIASASARGALGHPCISLIHFFHKPTLTLTPILSINPSLDLISLGPNYHHLKLG